MEMLTEFPYLIPQDVDGLHYDGFIRICVSCIKDSILYIILKPGYISYIQSPWLYEPVKVLYHKILLFFVSRKFVPAIIILKHNLCKPVLLV